MSRYFAPLAALLALSIAIPVPAQQAKPVVAVTPVYSQLVMYAYPPGFKPAYSKDSGDYYIQESVPAGETVEKWSQMVTLTGNKGLAANPTATPQNFAERIAGNFQRACPQTFAAQSLGSLKVGAYDAFAALMGCGSVTSGIPRSEIAVVVAIKGAADYYTLQWAERGPATQKAPALDTGKWVARVKQFDPVKLCARVPNEQAPYPSCINQK
jgi:hypothetical protein